MKVLFVGNTKYGFEKRDYEILKKHFDVESVDMPSLSPPSFIKSLIGMSRKISSSDLVFSWFADRNSMIALTLSKIFKKKNIVVIGGWDVENMPEIDYGAFAHPLEKILVKYVMNHADLLLPFSDYAVKKLENIRPKAKYIKVDLYCDTEKFCPSGKKENIVLTVGQVKENNLKRKGLENFVRAAKYLPDIKFILVGKWIDRSINYLKSIATPNVEFMGFLPEENLIRLYQKAKVYCQLSYQEGEGAGGAVGEAMACECIPVVSDKALALRDTVGDCGFYAPYGDHKKTAEIIKKALEAPDELGKKARERMVKFFSKEKREKKLKEIIEEMLT